jgi:hypothetical protein
MALITRELRVAGNGYSLLGLGQADRVVFYRKNTDDTPRDWFHYPGTAVTDLGAYPVYDVNMTYNNAVDRYKGDMITVCSMAPEFVAPLGNLSVDFNASLLTLHLDVPIELPAGYPEADKDEIIKAGDAIAIVPNGQLQAGNYPLILEVASDWKWETFPILSSIKIAPIPALPTGLNFNSYTAGSRVLNVKTLRLRTFKVCYGQEDRCLAAGEDTTSSDDDKLPFLLMDTQDEENQILAEGIEDLQTGFYFGTDVGDLVNNELDVTSSPVRTNDLKAIRVVLVSRTTSPDSFATATTYPRLDTAPLDHFDSASRDRYPKRKIDSVTQLRNY